MPEEKWVVMVRVHRRERYGRNEYETFHMFGPKPSEGEARETCTMFDSLPPAPPTDRTGTWNPEKEFTEPDGSEVRIVVSVVQLKDGPEVGTLFARILPTPEM